MKVLVQNGVPAGIKGLSFFLMLFSLFFTTVPAQAATAIPVRLSWDASPDPAVAGYRVYYNLSSLPTTNRQDVGASQTVQFSSLVANSTYKFYVVAYNSAGQESPPSNAIIYAPPQVSRLALGKMPNGAMQIQFKSAVGTSCRIQYSSSLNSPNWQTLTTGTADANGMITVFDPLTTRPAMRFYRAMRL
jgi:hypothetical protein